MKLLEIETDKLVRSFVADELRELELAVDAWQDDQIKEAVHLEKQHSPNHFAVAYFRERARAGTMLGKIIHDRRMAVVDRYETGEILKELEARPAGTVARQNPVAAGPVWLTAHETNIVAALLDMAGDKFSNHGCNDFSLSEHTTMNAEEMDALDLAVCQWNGDPGEHDPEDSHSCPSNWVLMNYFADKLRGKVVPIVCHRCSECVGQKHHSMGDGTCKHCDIRAFMCDNLDPACPRCSGSGWFFEYDAPVVSEP